MTEALTELRASSAEQPGRLTVEGTPLLRPAEEHFVFLSAAATSATVAAPILAVKALSPFVTRGISITHGPSSGWLQGWSLGAPAHRTFSVLFWAAHSIPSSRPAKGQLWLARPFIEPFPLQWGYQEAPASLWFDQLSIAPPVDLPQLEWLIRQGQRSGVRSEGTRQTAVRALDAVRELQEWLGYTERDVARAAGFARRSLAYWRSGKGVYPKTVRRLFELHAVVRGLVERLGVSHAAVWLSQPSAADPRRTRQEVLVSGQEGIHEVLSQARPILFSIVPTEQLGPEFEELELEADSVSSASPVSRPSGPPIRPRQP